MKKLLFIAAFVPATVMATEAAANIGVSDTSVISGTARVDTTFYYDGKRVELVDSAGTTRVSVYKSDGAQLTRTYETAFADGREIERVYVTSPFIPQTFGARKKSLNSHYPFFFMGD